MLFSAYEDGHGQELWRTDGTKAGTKLVRDINPAGDATPYAFTGLGKHIFFTATNGAAAGYELWKTDGTKTGTRMVRNIGPGPDSSYPCGETAYRGKLFFQASAAAGSELYVSRGTKASTHLIDFNLGPAGSSPFLGDCL